MMYTKVLVPLDGSLLAESALPYATEVAQKFGAQLVLLRVVEPTDPAPWQDGVTADATPSEAQRYLETRQAMRRAELREAERYLADVSSRLQAGRLQPSSQVVEGTAAGAIVEAAERQGIDLIAMSTHGRSGLGRLVYGSVADGVLRSASCPLLLIRAQEQKE